jgi:glycosyltransferase involved in cell wall biosynthesis
VLSVVHISKYYPPAPGGIERVVRSLCEVTRGRIASSVVAYNTTPSTEVADMDGVGVTRVGTWGSAGSVAVSPAFAAHLRRARADVMILHEPNPWALLSFAAVRPRMPLAIWFHSEVVRPKLQYELFYAPLARPAYRTARRFFVSSPDLAEQAAALRPYRDRVTVIPFGIDADSWRPDESVRQRAAGLREAAGRPVVLFAGRHVPYKGVPVLIRAAAPLDVQVVVLGDGPMRGDWMSLAAGAGGTARFVFPGEVDDHELRAWLAASRMLVLPSVTRAEAFGFVQLEAMACGTPVISTDLRTGVPWVNETGIVVPPGDEEALRLAIAGLARDCARAAAIGAAGEARVRAQFSIGSMGDDFVRACEEIAGSA